MSKAENWLMIAPRLEANIERLPKEGCWLWTGARNGSGYGRIQVARRRHLAHRVMYELANGPIPSGLVLDHLCRTPLCVRPDHLEAVSQRENLLRGKTITARNAAASHCPRGHEYSAANTVVRGGSRKCIECNRARNRAYHHAVRKHSRTARRLPCPE